MLFYYYFDWFSIIKKIQYKYKSERITEAIYWFNSARVTCRAEVSKKRINLIENGAYGPYEVLALKILKTLNYRVKDLFKLP